MDFNIFIDRNINQIVMIRKCVYSMVILFLVFLYISCDQKDIKRGLKAISEESVRTHIEFLSDDLLMGRAPGSEGSIMAQRYIEEEMLQLGLQPGIEDTSFCQPFEIVKMDMNSEIDSNCFMSMRKSYLNTGKISLFSPEYMQMRYWSIRLNLYL